MSTARTMDQVRTEYQQAAYELGLLAYQLQIGNDEIANLEYRMEKLKNNMKNLSKEGASIENANRAAEQESSTSNGNAQTDGGSEASVSA